LSIDSAKSQPVKLLKVINFRNLSWIQSLSSTYWTHIAICSIVEISVVLSTKTEKHFEAFTFLTIFYSIMSPHAVMISFWIWGVRYLFRPLLLMICFNISSPYALYFNMALKLPWFNEHSTIIWKIYIKVELNGSIII
jgi:hypothetical protein